MWLSKRSLGLLIAGAWALAACGYTPAYGPGGPAQQLRVQVAMDAPETRNDIDLVQQLELRLGQLEKKVPSGT